MKTCGLCKVEKEESEFWAAKDHAKGLAWSCKSCVYEMRAEFRKKASAGGKSGLEYANERRNQTYYPIGTDLRYQDITHERERELFAAARAGDESAREFLIKNHLLYAVIQSRKWSRGKLPEDEVVSAANYALITSFERFDHTRENRFTSFLAPAIRGAIARLWRSKNAVEMPVFPDKGDAVEVPTEDWVGHPTEADDHAEFLLRTMDAAKGVLTDREAEVIRLLFGEEKLDMADIAELKGLSRERIRQIKEAALMKLRREMKRRMDEAGETR